MLTKGASEIRTLPAQTKCHRFTACATTTAQFCVPMLRKFFDRGNREKIDNTKH